MKIWGVQQGKELARKDVEELRGTLFVAKA